MEFVVGRKVPLPGSVSPFAVTMSQCGVVAAVTLQGVHLFVSYFVTPVRQILAISFFLCLLTTPSQCLDFTDQVFEGKPTGMLAAFGDFNSDKLTDTFIIADDQRSFSVLLAKAEAPFLRKNNKLICHMTSQDIVSLVPGDFDGDAAMDILVVTKATKWGKNFFQAVVAWGSLTELSCPDGLSQPLIHLHGEPLVMDYNRDMISDLFGLDVDLNRQFWIFNTSRAVDHIVSMEGNSTLRLPHSHSFLDLDGDSSADLLLTGLNFFELWRYNSKGRFEFNSTIPLPGRGGVMGQSIFIDFDFDGLIDHLVPVCTDSRCSNSTFYIYKKTGWLPIDCDLRDPFGNQWIFHPPDSESFYLQAVTARSGDFNLDGYPDLLITLLPAPGVRPPHPRAVLLENVESVNPLKGRKLSPRWDLLTEWNSSIMATFYDIQEKGALDVLLVHRDGLKQPRLAAYKSSLDYDANFIKVLVLTGRCFANCSHNVIPYGTNLAGPCISYKTTQPTGEIQLSAAKQLCQSAYNALQLPYTLFGLARSPNFIETLHIGLDGSSREWTQIIPNSQMIIIPTMDGKATSWLNKLFVTPSRAIVLSAAALAGFGFLLACVVAILHCRERRSDKLEEMAVVNRFHFDAM